MPETVVMVILNLPCDKPKIEVLEGAKWDSLFKNLNHNSFKLKAGCSISVICHSPIPLHRSDHGKHCTLPNELQRLAYGIVDVTNLLCHDSIATLCEEFHLGLRPRAEFSSPRS